MRKETSLKTILGSILIGGMLASGFSSCTKTTIVGGDHVLAGSTIKGNAQVVVGTSPKDVAKLKTQNNEYRQMLKVTSEKNKYLAAELNRYKRKEKLFIQDMAYLNYKIDSLEDVCIAKDDKIYNLNLFAEEFHVMNNRYGHLPDKLERKISNYLSKKE